jgi:uncharacterized protein YjbI with pentapeptide repeats
MVFGSDSRTDVIPQGIPRGWVKAVGVSGATIAVLLTAAAPLSAEPEPAARKQLETTGNCPGCALSAINLRYRDLSGANLAGADLRNADLTFTNLSNANLAGADLTGVNLERANLSGATLSGATLSRASLVQTNLQNANIDNAKLSEALLQGAQVGNVSAAGATLCYATLPDGSFSTQGCPLFPQ